MPRRRTKKLSNGAIYDLDKGHIVANPGGGTYAITKETSQLMHQRRRDLRIEAAVEGAAEGLKVPNSSPDVVRAIFKKLAELLRNAEGSRGGAEVAKVLLKDLMPAEDLKLVSFEQRTYLLNLLRDDGEVVDGELEETDA